MIGTTTRSKTLVDDELERDSIDTFGRRFEAALAELAGDGLDAAVVARLADTTAEIDRDLDRLYADKFPKKCNTCGRVYQTRAEYLEMTRELRSEGTFFDEDFGEVQEYRDCACGSSLLVLTTDRRDESPFGRRRREMFDVWLNRLVRDTGRSRDELAPLLRQVFRAALARARNES